MGCLWALPARSKMGTIPELLSLFGVNARTRHIGDCGVCGHKPSPPNLRLIDGSELVTLILQHYEELDSRYKGLLPLKRVYVPEALEEAEE